MNEILKSIEDHLKANLKRPAESILIMGLIEKFRQDTPVKKIIHTTPEVLFCPKCEKWITENEVNSKITFRQTSTEPEEREEFCKHCGGSAEDFEEMQLDAEELAEVLNDLKFRL